MQLQQALAQKAELITIGSAACYCGHTRAISCQFIALTPLAQCCEHLVVLPDSIVTKTISLLLELMLLLVLR